MGLFSYKINIGDEYLGERIDGDGKLKERKSDIANLKYLSREVSRRHSNLKYYPSSHSFRLQDCNSKLKWHSN